MFRIVLTLLVSFMLLAGISGCTDANKPSTVENRPTGLGLGGGAPNESGSSGPPAIEH